MGCLPVERCSSRLSVSVQATSRMLFQSLSLGPLLVLAASCLAIALAASARERRQVGAAGVDYPTYSEVPPRLSFSCDDKIPGYYADPETQCQVWHWCVPGGTKYSFLCPNQTLFNQLVRVCDWWFNVDCSSSPDNYNINEDLYKIPEDDAPLGRDLHGEESAAGELVEQQQQELQDQHQQTTEQIIN